MALIDNIIARIAKMRGVTIAPTSSVTVAPPVDYGESVDNSTALKITAFYAGIRLISENIASLPRAVRHYTAEGTVEETAHTVYRLINVRPNDYTNTFDFWNCMTTWLEGWGNAYAVIVRGQDGRPASIHQVHPTAVSSTFVNGKRWYRVTVAEQGLSWLTGTYSADDILHFMLVTLDGLDGVNPVVYNALALGKNLATERFSSDYYRNKGNIRAVMETDGSLGDEAYDRFVDHFKAASADNFSTPLLEYGIKYKQLSVDPMAAQLVQSETLSLQDVARILNIPPHMIGELSHATFSNIEHQTIQFVEYTLRPIIKRFEVELRTKMFFPSEVGGYDIEFALGGLLRGDTAARSAYYHNAILDGYMSRNEVRELEGLQRRDGLDDMLCPLNYSVVGKDGEPAGNVEDKKTEENEE
jgi:HK97 family phage portal protein